MHILTKVLVVFAAVLSILLSALSIAYAANADRIVADINLAKSQKVSSDAALQAQTSQWAIEQARLAGDNDQVRRQMAELEADRNRLSNENATLLGDKNRAEIARQGVEAKLAELGETAKTQAELMKAFREEIGGLRDTDLRLRKQALDLEDRNSELDSQLEVYQQTVRALQEQLAEAKLAMDGARTGAGAGATGETFRYTGPIILGRIEDVRVDAGSGQTLVQVNVGSNDNVRDNMLFSLVSSDRTTFLGNVIVTKTDLKFSIGRVDALGKPVNVKVGDLIFSRLQ